MVDVLDRAATLNFTCVVSIRGRLSEVALRVALRKLERRHPLLRARIERRRSGAVFVMDEGAPVLLRVLDREPNDWQSLAESTLVHRVWPDAGPRAELTWLRHSATYSTLMLTMHHVVSDAHSGFVALRDLLGFVTEPWRVPEPVPSLGQHTFYPEHHGDMGWLGRAAKMAASAALAPKPRRLRREARRDVHRRPKVATVTFGLDQTAGLLSRTREYDVSLHGLICAALAKGYVEAGHWRTEAAAPLRLCHPVDLRRYVRSQLPDESVESVPVIDDAVGYFLSSLDTDHVVTEHSSLVTLAREITSAIRSKKSAGEPWLTTPLASPMITRPVAGRTDLSRFAELVERHVFLSSCSVSSLGTLERLGLQHEMGALRVEHAFFVSGASLLSAMTTSTSVYAGRLTLVMQWMEPLITAEAARHVLGHAERELNGFALGGGAKAARDRVKMR